MGTFKSNKTFYASPSLIPAIAQSIATEFGNDGYQVQCDSLLSGGCDISITKGGLFKAVLGMKTALKVNIMPSGNGININAGVGIFGQQAIPTVISMFFFWPVIITQITGLISQAKMDDRVMDIAAATIARYQGAQSGFGQQPPAYGGAAQPQGAKFCTNCGSRNPENAKFCSNCGKQIG